MKKILTALLCILLLCPALTACGEGAFLDYSDVGYDGSGWNHAQGLACDGEFFYFAGHNDKTNENADIHKIDMKTAKEVAVFYRAGAMHSAVLAMYEKHGTLLTSSGGDGRKPFLYELDTTDGSLKNSWNFDGVGENGGAGIAYTGGDDVVLFTSSKDGAKIAFTKFTLLENGGFIQGETYSYSETDLGVPQGVTYHNGYLYYLADAGITVNNNPHYVYKLNAETYEIVDKRRIKINAETEGLAIDKDDNLYFGTAKEKIYKARVF